MELVEVDGSRGEGGGQILRTAITFSTITGRPVRVSRIRAGRPVPGLRRQHVSFLRVVHQVFESSLRGDTEGSGEVDFVPGPPRSRSISFEMGTAASITLVLQAAIPAAALAGDGLRLELAGGTDVPWSPTLDYLATAVREAYGALGIDFTLRTGRRGYYPRGGGRVTAEVGPCRRVMPLSMADPSKVVNVELASRCAMLPRRVAERQALAASAALEQGGIGVSSLTVTEEQADSPGSSVLVHSAGAGSFILGSDELGARGKPAEEVGRAAARRFLAYASSGACLDDNLADMVAPLLALAGRRSRLRVAAVSEHLAASMYVAGLFAPGAFDVRREGAGHVLEIGPK